MTIQNPSIEPYWKWALMEARSYSNITTDPAAIQDLAQEAWIAIWTELDKANREGREVNDSYLKRKGKWTILSIIRAPKMLAEVPVDTDEFHLVAPVGETPDLARHTSEIHAAIRELTPRQQEYVYLRFWRELAVKTELAALGFGRPIWYRTPDGARARLRARLAHLEDAVN